MSTVATLVLGPLLTVALVVFAVGIAMKFLLYFLVAYRESHTVRGLDARIFFKKAVWLLLPISPAFGKKPVATTARYLFHVCLIAGPVLLASHVVLWQSSRLGLHWPALPGPVSRGFTFVALAGSGIYLARRMVVRKVREESKGSNYAFIVIVLLCFLTGYLLADDSATFDPAHFWSAPGPLGILHAACASVLLVTVAFLYMQVKYRRTLCTTCGACSLRCPAGAIKMSETDGTRSLLYRAKVCVHCETCVTVCPEGAAHMEHVITATPFFRWGFSEMQTVPLAVCTQCQQTFRPLPQVDNVRVKVRHAAAFVCPACKRRLHIQKMRLSRS